MKDALSFVKRLVPSKTRQILREGISRNLVRSRLGRPDSKTAGSDTFRVQSKTPNLTINYNEAKKMVGMSYEFVGAADKRNPLMFEDMEKKLEDHKPRTSRNADFRQLKVKKLGLVLSFGIQSNILEKIEVVAP